MCGFCGWQADRVTRPSNLSTCWLEPSVCAFGVTPVVAHVGGYMCTGSPILAQLSLDALSGIELIRRILFGEAWVGSIPDRQRCLCDLLSSSSQVLLPGCFPLFFTRLFFPGCGVLSSQWLFLSPGGGAGCFFPGRRRGVVLTFFLVGVSSFFRGVAVPGVVVVLGSLFFSG